MQLQSDGWTKIAPSRSFTQPLLDYVVQADAPRIIFETDGYRVAESVDGGCSFTDVYAVPALPSALGAVTSAAGVSASTIATVKKLAMSPVKGGRTMALLETSLAGASDVEHHTLVATNAGGNTWSLGQNGLPIAGRALDLSVANENIAYLLTAPTASAPSLGPGPGAGAGATIYSTNDGGLTWSPGSAALQFTRLTVDPAHPSTIYGFGPSGLYTSTDSGQVFTKISSLSDAISDVAVYPLGAPFVGLGLVYASLVKGGLAYGITGSRSPTPGVWPRVGSYPISALDHTGGLGLDPNYAVSVADFVSNGQYFVGLQNGRNLAPFNLTPYGAGVLAHPTAARGGWVQLTDHYQIWRAQLQISNRVPSVVAPPVNPLKPITVGVTKVRAALPAQLLPADQTVTLRPGESTSVPLRLKLPATPTPLDVMFVIDTTSSMAPTVDGLRTGVSAVAKDLATSGLDVNFGLGDFQDYPIAPYGCPGPPYSSVPFFGQGGSCAKADHPWERLLPVSPPGPALGAALQRLTPLGNGADAPEATLVGVYQAVTGEGQTRIAGIPASGYYVTPGQDAKFRPGAVKVLVVATDINFAVRHSNGGPPCAPGTTSPPTCDSYANYPGPSWEKVIAAVAQHDVRVVGLDVSGFDNSDAFHDLSRLAAGARTFAPAGGVDCNGDRSFILPAASPLVCPITATGDSSTLNLAPAILSLLKALRDLTAVGFTVTSTDHRPGVALMRPASIPLVDVKTDNLLGVRAVLNCPAGPDTTNPLTIGATVRGTQIATAHLTLECRALPKAPPPVIPVVPLIAPALVIPIAPPAPPAQLPQSNPNPNPQANVQPGAAAEQQEDPQLAVAGADPVAEPDQEVVFDQQSSKMEMSAVHATTTTGPPPGFEFFLVAIATVCAAGGAVAVARHRRAVQHALAWVDRSR